MKILTNLLTQNEVNSLPVGSKVFVLWSGGNGIHAYVITGKFNGISLVNNNNIHCLNFVGKENYHTKVSLIEP